ncbi:MAG: glycosyl hydrolase [Planctomycetia bacterium]|nr:glycosyl hydrolase [Planctomycetia bacterium]
MKRTQKQILKLLLILALFWLSITNNTIFAQISSLNLSTNPTTAEVKETFLKGPGRHFSTAPLWVWNDFLTEEQIRQTLQDLASQQVKQAFVHPRPGLMTPYLSADWFRLWKVALDEAEKLDMNIWIYDENSYPSGFAGGLVPESLPESRGKGLLLQTVSSLETIDENILFIYQKNANGQYQNVSEEMKKSKSLPKGEWLVAKTALAGSSSWFGGTFYVDLLQKGVTEKFIEITHEAYKREVGDQFAKRLPGIFTDEPHLQSAGHFTWTEDLPEFFENKFHYSLIDALPLLICESTLTLSNGSVVTWKQARHNFQQTLLKMFIERWSKPNFNFCEENKLEFTGHYWEHGWPGVSSGPDNMAMYAWHQRPAIDLLMNNWSDSVNAQFGNNRAVRELGSVANQLGHSRTLSETYGAGGWDLRFEDMKRIGDWSYALGVNTTDEHLSYITIRGARKHDHPQSFSYHASWWDAYNAMANYHTRISYLISQGVQKNDILVIQPTTTAWMYQGNSKLNEIGNSFADFIRKLEAAQIEYDLGSEDIIERLGKVDKGSFQDKNGLTVEKTAFCVGKASYRYVVLPPFLENLNRSTLMLLCDFVKKGGKIFYFSDLPNVIDGKTLDSLDETTSALYSELLASSDQDSATEFRDFSEKIERFGLVRLNVDSVYFMALLHRMFFVKGENEPATTGTSFSNIEAKNQNCSLNKNQVFHQRRYLANGEFIFICNTNNQEAVQGKILCRPLKSLDQVVYWSKIEQLDLQTGTISPYLKSSYDQSQDVIFLDFDLPPCGSLALLMTYGESPWESQTLSTSKDVIIEPLDIPKVERVDPNVLVIDYCDLKVGNESLENAYFYAANDQLWKNHGFPGGNPWNTSVQFRDSLISKTFDPQSGFEATYKFNIDKEFMTTLDNENRLYAVVEAAHLYDIACNGKSIAPQKGDWFLDRSFGKIDISGAIQSGENSLSIKISPMNMFCEIMPIFIIGDFSLKYQEKGFLICPSKPLQFVFENGSDPEHFKGHSSEQEGVSWLSSGINYEKGKNDLAPYILFNLGKKYKVCGAKIWNYVEINQTKRGIAKMTVLSKNEHLDKVTENEWSEFSILGKFSLNEAPSGGTGSPFYPEMISFDESVEETDCILIKIDSNHAGITYPVPESDIMSDRFKDTNNDNAFVGLSEIEFLTQNDQGEYSVIPDVTVEKCSSELVFRSFDRKAKYLVDRSGLYSNNFLPTWNNQGMPFYSNGVSYSETFDIKEHSETNQYFVKLPRIGSLEDFNLSAKWNGAVAKVFVNKELVGYIFCEPCECEITKWIQKGQNVIDVVIVGTPKNLFGPHHSGKIRGSAWPHCFFNAPASQPSGIVYDVIPYGLLEPFVVIQR